MRISLRRFRVIAAIFVTSILAACSGSAPISTVPPSQQGSGRNVVFTVRWNGTSARAQSAQSLSIAVNDKRSAPEIVNRGRSLTSTRVAVPPGNDVFYVRLWSGPDGTGTPLGGAAIPKHVTSETTSPVAISLAGPCAQIEFGPAANQPFVVNLNPPATVTSATSTSGFELAGPQTETFVATALDSNGNAIVGPDAPEVALLQLGTRLFDIQEVNETTGENTFNFTPRSGISGSNPAQILPVSLQCPTSIFRPQPVPLYAASIIYVETQSPSVPYGTINVYDRAGHPISLPSAFPGLFLAAPDGGMTYDGHNNTIYVANSGANNVLAFKRDGQPVSLPGSFPNLDGDVSIAFDPQNTTLYVGNVGETAGGVVPYVSAFDENGNPSSVITTPFPGAFGPFGMTWDSANGFIYMGLGICSGSIGIGEYGPDGTPHGLPRPQFVNSCGFQDLAYSRFSNRFLATSFDPGAVGVWDGFGNIVPNALGAYTGLQGATGIAIDSVTNNSYVANCPSGLAAVGNPNAPGFVKIYDPNGNDLTPPGSFPGLGCAVGVLAIGP